MKKIVLTLSLISLFMSTAVLAAPVANLKVAGSITPPTCTVNGGDSADLIYSFGSISPSVIPQDSTYNGLPSISNNLTVTCDAETFLTFKATDNYPNEFIQTPGMNINYRSHSFNLVDVTDTSKTIGGISYSWLNVTVDGKPAYISRANDGSYDNGTWSQERQIIKNATNGWTKTQQRYVAPPALDLLSGKIFNATFYNSIAINYGVGATYLHSKNMLTDDGIDITNGLDYLGQVVLNFNFGV
ncbi:fimbrial protein (plasmid) [Providencia rettgeri]|uniref:fimbrial protein n=1 Tax=Providencia rettgeri TaxID=587 RepID=UPI001CA6CD3E|nr:fimbrial protein [Providencia rettgeri]QZY66542.1 fimbrial protein [Providencia rettgeri]